jgi:hypothetical protein
VKMPWYLYKTGLSHPTVGRPAAKRAAFTRPMIPPATGADADVPDESHLVPPMTTMKLLPAIEMSG